MPETLLTIEDERFYEARAAWDANVPADVQQYQCHLCLHYGIECERGNMFDALPGDGRAACTAYVYYD